MINKLEILNILVVLFVLFSIKKIKNIKTLNLSLMLSSIPIATIIAYSIFIEYNNKNFYYLIFSIAIGLLVSIIIHIKTTIKVIPELIIFYNLLGSGSIFIIDIVILNQQKEINSIIIYYSLYVSLISFIGSIIALNKLKNIYNYQKYIYFLITILYILIIIISNDYKNILYFLIVLICIFLLNRIKGNDMPIIISLLNSITGIAVALCGIFYENILIIICGLLVGSSGLMLTKNMMKSMNKNLYKIFIKKKDLLNQYNYENVKISNIENIIEIILNVKNIIIVPGYGMALSQSQYKIAELINILCRLKKNVKIAVHPVAGRMPGHMNILLAEAKINNSYIYDINSINNEFSETDLSIIIGANDIININAINDKESEIYGMPILEVYKSKWVYILKRSLDNGYSGIKNDIFNNKNTFLILNDAKITLTDIITNLL